MKKNRLLPFFAVLVLTVCLAVLTPAAVVRAAVPVNFYQNPAGSYIPYSPGMTLSYSASGLGDYEEYPLYAAFDAEPYPPTAATQWEDCVELGQAYASLTLNSPGTHTVFISIIGPGGEIAARCSSSFTAYTAMVTLDSQGGSAVDPLYFVPDTPAQTLPTPTRAGFVFDGWYTDPVGGAKEASPVLYTSSATLYAHWIDPSACTVTFDPNGGAFNRECTQTKPITAVTVSGRLEEESFRHPYRVGYQFIGWFTAKTGGDQITADEEFTKDVTLYAHWWKGTPSGQTQSAGEPAVTLTLTSDKNVYTEGETVHLTLKAANLKDGSYAYGMTLNETACGDDVLALENGQYALDLSNLPAGRHTVVIEAEGKTASVEFEVIEKSDPAPVPASESVGSSRTALTGTGSGMVFGGTFTQDANGTWHYSSTGGLAWNTWGIIVNPYAKDGLNTSDWFWVDTYGNMLTGWQFINGKWYYLNPQNNGACLLGPGVTPDGYQIDATTGAWIEH